MTISPPADKDSFNDVCGNTWECSHLGSRDTQEADGHEHSSDRNLIITKLDPIEVLHAKTVRSNQTVQSEDLVHLNSGDESASPLSNDRGDWRNRIS